MPGMPGKKELGEALRLLRSRRGWLQKELAAAAKISKGMMSGYERGKTRPTLVTLGKLLTALEADLCDLYCAVEMVNGRPAAAHGLSAQFQAGTATPPRPALVRPADRRPAAAAPSTRAPGGEPAAGEQQLPADIEQALSEMMGNLHTVARYYLGWAAAPR
jgi:transcriptional regulator with XRE-family HTH domain